MKIFYLLLLAVNAHADPCGQMEVFDSAMHMCMPLPMSEMPMSMLMLHGNLFLTGISESDSRGRNALAAPHFIMADIGTSVGKSQYVNLDFMGTAERWTFPDRGSPELLQIGEENNSGAPYLDAQHPHSSPVMGLTLSDTIRLAANKDSIKLFFAPRGESTDGPVSFMHRPTGMVNPEVPLGHHIGQDVGHIASTVLGESLKLGQHQIEFSTYHGAEPQPQKVDLPFGKIDSYSLRWIEQFSENSTAMISYAYVTKPEIDEPDILSENRYSASVYRDLALSDLWKMQNAFIWGTVSSYDHASTLTSFTEEFLFQKDIEKFWGRIEALERTPAELQVIVSGDPNKGKWVEALTVGYTRSLTNIEGVELEWGASLKSDFLPSDYREAYGDLPLTAQIFLQASGTKMWHL